MDERQNQDQPDERTHLIPAAPDLVDPTHEDTSPDGADTQRRKDRMGSIVRQTEAKMVNVAARLPFNLRGTHHPSTSASAHPSHTSSLSFSSSSRSASHADLPHPHAQAPIQVHVGAPLPSASRPPLVHYAVGAGDASRSSSMASRDTGDGSLVRVREGPILGLRLVKVPVPVSRDAGGSRGRRKQKALEEEVGGGVENEGTPRELVLPHSHADDASVHTDDALDTPRGERGGFLHSAPAAGQAEGPEICVSPASSASAADAVSDDERRGGTPIVRKTATLETQDFVLREDGPITISWGD